MCRLRASNCGFAGFEDRQKNEKWLLQERLQAGVFASESLRRVDVPAGYRAGSGHPERSLSPYPVQVLRCERGHEATMERPFCSCLDFLAIFQKPWSWPLVRTVVITSPLRAGRTLLALRRLSIHPELPLSGQTYVQWGVCGLPGTLASRGSSELSRADIRHPQGGTWG